MVQKVNITLDNVSPLISYSPQEAWHEGDSRDLSWQLYNHGTFTLTTQFGASASITFNGTGVWIYGAKRGNHAPYNTTLDGRTVFNDGYSSVDMFQQVLFAGDGLDPGTHTVSIADSVVDAEKPYLDIDSIVYEVEVLDDDDGVTQQDTASAFSFSPSAWSTNPENLEAYSGGTGHVTSSPDAWVVYTFEVGAHHIWSFVSWPTNSFRVMDVCPPHEDSLSDNQIGSSVEIYGAVGPTNGAYTVQIDDGQSTTLNGTKNNLIPQTLIYQGNNLTPGSHTVKISNSPFVGQTLSIDYAVIHTSSSAGSSSGSTSSLNGGAIGGIVVGACAGILLVLVGVFLWYRRRNKRSGDHGTGPVIFHTPSLPATVEQYPLSISTSSTTMLQPPPTATPTPSPPHSNSSASNSDSRSRLIMHNPNPSFNGPGPSGILGPTHDVAPVSENTTQLYPSYITRPLPQPESSNSRLPANTSALPSLPGADLRNVRMQVEGRSQDFGPITFVPEPEHDGNLLPPDYNQAIEPFPSRRR